MLAVTTLSVAAHAQRAVKVPVPADKTDLDSVPALTAEDSARFRARTTAAKKPFDECTGPAFQTCASGAAEARLASDGTAYGVLLTRADGKSAFLWRITGRVSGGGEGGGGGRKRSRGGARAAKRRG